jgi:hypothetical protein
VDGRAARENGFVAEVAGCENGDEMDGTIVRVDAIKSTCFNASEVQESEVFCFVLGYLFGFFAPLRMDPKSGRAYFTKYQ